MKFQSLCTLATIAAFSWLGTSSLVAQEAPRVEAETEWAPVVKRLSGEDLPVARKLSTFVTHMDKMAKNSRENAKWALRARGLEVEDAELDLLNQIYGEFDEDQGERHTTMLLEAQGRAGLIETRSWDFVLERASFTGGVLGAWLVHLRSAGKDTDSFLRSVAENYSVSAFWGGKAPTLERIAQEARAFEASFAEEYGAPLEAVLEGTPEGGER